VKSYADYIADFCGTGSLREASRGFMQHLAGIFTSEMGG
jgi:hypothetical protein